MAGWGRKGRRLSQPRHCGRKSEKRHRYLWPGGARPVCRSRAWQAPLSSESSRLLRAESQLQEAELGAPSPARLSNYWTPVNSVGSGSQNLPRDWKVSMSIHSHETTCPVLGTFSDSLGSMPLYLEADDNPQSRSPDTLSTSGRAVCSPSRLFSRQQG